MRKTAIATTALALAFAMGPGWIPAIAQEAVVTGEARAQEDIWLPGLTTETPQEGFALAVKLSRMGRRRSRIPPCSTPCASTTSATQTV